MNARCGTLRFARRSLISAVVLTLAWTGAMQAGVNNDWDWVGEKRNLKVWVNVPAGTKLGDVAVSDAVDNAKTQINGAGSKWMLDTSGTMADHDIEIKIADIDEDVGGAQNEYTKIDKDRKVSKRTVVIDSTPKGGESWGSAGNKFDPRTVIMHELLHKLRIKHQGGVTNTSGNVADPSQTGSHQTTLSDDDKTDLKDSGGVAAPAPGTGAPVQKNIQNVNPGAGAGFGFEGSSMTIPVNAFSAPAEVGFSLTRDEETTLDPFDVPGFPDHRVFKGVLLDITQLSSPVIGVGTVSFSLAYEETTARDIDDPEFDPIIESTISAFIYDTTSGVWNLAPTISQTLDTGANILNFTIPASALVSPTNAGFDPSNPSTIFTYVGLGGQGVPIPEPGTVLLALVACGFAAKVRARRR